MRTVQKKAPAARPCKMTSHHTSRDVDPCQRQLISAPTTVEIRQNHVKKKSTFPGEDLSIVPCTSLPRMHDKKIMYVARALHQGGCCIESCTSSVIIVPPAATRETRIGSSKQQRPRRGENIISKGPGSLGCAATAKSSK